MHLVQWQHDSRSETADVVYFTRGSELEQRADAEAFAATLNVDVERGCVTIKRVPSGARAHPELS